MQEAYQDLRSEKLGTGDVSSFLRARVSAAFHSLHSDSQGYLLVYSITDDTTFSKLDRLREEIVKAQTSKGKKQPPIFLIGTKADLEDDRAVTVQERKAKAKAWGARSFEVSAKTDSGVKDVFQEMIKAVLASSINPSKGGAGGSVMGAGRTPARKDAAPAKKDGKCIIV